MVKVQADSNGKVIMLDSKALMASGITPTGTLSITANGTYDVTNYANADVNVSGGGSSTTGFLVQAIDYDGTVLKSERLDEGDTFTLPSQPSHTGLVFQSWSSPVAITNNTVTVTNSDITIGATYTTASGLSEFDITLTTVTGLSVTLNMNGTKNWGDGTSDTNTTHTYSSVGDYTITCDGSTLGVNGLFGQTSSNINYYVKDVRFGSSITNISSGGLQYCYSLTNVIIPNSVTSIGSGTFGSCYSLTNVIIPNSVTSISGGTFNGCYSLVNVTIPSSITSIGNNAFQNCNSLTNITIPSSVTSIGNSVFQYCRSLTSITIPSSVTSIGNNAFQNCNSLTSITIPEGATSIGTSAFQNCYSLTSITIPEGVTRISTSVFQNCYSLTSITIPEGVTSIGNSAFSNCYSILEYDFSNHTAVPTLSGTNAFTNINQICKIKVPASLEAQWKEATNWSTYADYIVGV